MHLPSRLALLLLALLPAACATTPRTDAPEPLVGAWRSHIQFASGDYAAVHDMEFLYAFNPGETATSGVMTESSNYDAAPPGPPAYGVWLQTGPLHFDAFYVFNTTATPETPGIQGWAPAGRGELTEHITLAPDTNSFTSTLTLQLFDATGKPIEGGGAATGRAQRIGF